MNKVITINRQYGSGGREIGRKLAEAYGLHGRRVNNQEDLCKAIEEALASGEGYVIDCMIDIDEMVRPMVKAGDPIVQFLLD